MAVALVDFVQGLIMIAGVVLMVYFVLGHEMVNGFVNGFCFEPGSGLILPTSPVTWIGLLSLIILTSLGTWGLPRWWANSMVLRTSSLYQWLPGYQVFR